jgi:hypothetical protein
MSLDFKPDARARTKKQKNKSPTYRSLVFDDRTHMKHRPISEHLVKGHLQNMKNYTEDGPSQVAERFSLI